jgi:hypothetical protein
MSKVGALPHSPTSGQPRPKKVSPTSNIWGRATPADPIKLLRPGLSLPAPQPSSGGAIAGIRTLPVSPARGSSTKDLLYYFLTPLL